MTTTMERSSAPPPSSVKVPKSGGAMRKVSMRGLMAHKMRFILTLLAVTLGTAFVTGSFILTNTLGNSINAIVGGSYETTSVVVSPTEGSAEAIPLSLVDTIRGVDGVYGVEPQISAMVALIGADGHAIATGGAPTQGLAWTEGQNNASVTPHIVAGRAPTATDEVAINVSGLEKGGLAVGDTTKVLLPKRGLVPIKIVGSYDTNFAVGGYIGVTFPLKQALEEFTDGKSVYSIAVRTARDSSVTQTELRDRITKVLPSGVHARTAKQVIEKASEDVKTVTGFLTSFLLVFGVIGLGVGASLIYITFSMVIAQRMRELALLRAIGASRGQILRSVLAEGLVVGTVGSLIGIGVGFLLGLGLLALMTSRFGVPLGGASLTPNAVVAALTLGIGVTVLSAIAPAFRAGSIAPVEAMRGQFATPRPGKVRLVVGLIILGLGIALTVYGTSNGLWVLGAGFVVVLLSLVMLSVYLAPLVFSVVRPLTSLTPIGRIAHGNTIRNPKRTASTAFALAIGLALVSALSIVGASSKASLTEVISQGQKWDYTVTTTQRQPLLNPRIVTQLKDTPGVGSMAVLGFAPVRVNDADHKEETWVSSVNGPINDLISPAMVSGTMSVSPTTFVANEGTATERKWTAGQKVTFYLPDGGSKQLTLSGVMKDGGSLDPMAVDSSITDLYTALEMRNGTQALIKATPGTSSEQLRSSLEATINDFPLATVMTREAYIKSQTSSVDVFLGILYGLLGLALVISILGIVNTLALSVVERTREVGMMRAIGAQRAQIRRMVTLEAVMICLYGTLIGLVTGLTYGWLLVGTMKDDGLTTRVIPWGQTGIAVIAAIVVALLAAIWPAIKAARTKPLEAIAED